jgi:hypothetical protein
MSDITIARANEIYEKARSRYANKGVVGAETASIALWISQNVNLSKAISNLAARFFS